jgi:hypothetical protein
MSINTPLRDSLRQVFTALISTLEYQMLLFLLHTSYAILCWEACASLLWRLSLVE